MQTMIDTEGLKNGVDLRDLVSRFVELRRESAQEFSGPCPKCGGRDRLHVTEWWFFCRQCHTKRGDAIEFIQWIGRVHGFQEACTLLGTAVSIPTSSKHSIKPVGWSDPVWQREARTTLARSQDVLESPEGEPGRGYLKRRGIFPETWRAWHLGYTVNAWDSRLQTKRGAIILPWTNRQLTALKYRFVDVPEGGLRYTMKAGGQCLVFDLRLEGNPLECLWLMEGELNAISLWQELRADCYTISNVISFGAESGAVNGIIVSIARQYQRVVVWCDNPNRTRAAMGAIPNSIGLCSPVHNGAKLDANELLQSGHLGEFVRYVRQGIGSIAGGKAGNL